MDIALPASIPVRSAARAPLPADGVLYCEYLWESITLRADGYVTCGFDDPFGRRDFGHAGRRTIREIFNGPEMDALRRRLLQGSRCAGCHLHSKVGDLRGAPLPGIPEMPRRLILETTIRCNLRCRNTSCDLNNDRGFKVREVPFLDWNVYTRVMDELGPHLTTLCFFNYGEPFLHPRALDMLAHARRVNPAIHIATSTNGILLARGEVARRLVEEDLLDYANFTIAGPDDATYQRYHKGGSFEEAFEGMRRLAEARRAAGRTRPEMHWRYLLFDWNDDDARIARARDLAREIGVELRFFLCSAPLEGRTRRRAPGTPGHAAIVDALDREVHYGPDPYADAGLYQPEFDAALGAYAWTSRRARLAMPPGGVSAVSLARKGVGSANTAKVTLSTPWWHAEARVGRDRWHANAIPAPPRGLAGPHELVIEVDEVHIPYRHGTADDYRELGVMVALDLAGGTTPRALPPAVSLPAPGLPLDEIETARMFVRRQYRELLARPPDGPGEAHWVDRLRAGAAHADVALAFLASDELERGLGDVVRLVIAALHRRPDAATLREAIALRRASQSLGAIASHLAGLAEVRARVAIGEGRPARAADLLATIADARFRTRRAGEVFVLLAYALLVERVPDPQAYDFWLDRLERRPLTGGDLVAGLLASPEYRCRVQALHEASPAGRDH